MTKTCAIALIATPNYAMQISVVIASIIANKKNDYNYEYYIFTNKSKEYDLETTKKLEDNFNHINIIDLGDKYQDMPNDQRWSNLMFFKMDIPFVLSEYDRVLYLDGDMIVNNDISELFELDFEDNYAAVTPDITQVLQPEILPELDNYFNAGTILFNCKKIREDFSLDYFIQSYLNNRDRFLSLEQDVFNYNFNKKLLHLPINYNYIVLYDFYLKSNLTKFYHIEDKSIQKKENLKILHYVSMPCWKYFNLPYQNLWDKYYKLCPFYKPLKRKFYNPFFNVYRFVRYNYKFKKFKKKAKFNYMENDIHV